MGVRGVVREVKHLMFDFFCGLGGASEGFLAEGWECVGIDNERHDYGNGGYPGHLILQDIMTFHGSQAKDADFLWFSPPCQAFSWMAMPWSLAKKKAAEISEDYWKWYELTRLFVRCFEIQLEASEAAGHHIPLIVENVRGAQPWVGPAKAHYGSFYLWGDIGMANGNIICGNRKELLPASTGRHSPKVPWFRFDGSGGSFQTASVNSRKNGEGTQWRSCGCNEENRMVPRGVKAPGMNWSDQTKPGQDFTRIAGQQAGRKTIHQISKAWRAKHYDETDKMHLTNQRESDSVKHGEGGVTKGPNGGWFKDLKRDGKGETGYLSRSGSKSNSRKAASAQIAKIPFPLASYIARCFRP